MTDPILEPIVNLNTNFPLIGISLTIASVWLVSIIARKMVRGAVSRSLRRAKFSSMVEREQRIKTLVAVFTSIIAGLAVIIGLIIILIQLGVDLRALVTGIGALGVVIGLAGQNVFKDLYKGVAILLFDQMRVDGIVEIAGKSGVVESMTLLVTTLRDMDGMQHVVPNGEITVITNMSRNFANVNFDIRVAYDADLDKAEAVMNELGLAIAGDPEFEAMFFEPIQFLRVNSFDDVGVNLKALGKVEPGKQWSMAALYRRRLLALFHDNDIQIPLPQLYVHSVTPDTAS